MDGTISTLAFFTQRPIILNKTMSELNELVSQYQAKVRAEKLELLRLELPKQRMIEFLIEFQQPTKQRRISAKTLAYLITHFERDWGNIETFFDKVEELKMSIDRWCTLRNEAEKMPANIRKKWQINFNDATEIRSEIIVRVAELVPKVRYSVVGTEKNHAEDLDGVGYIGLIKALENFDITRGVPFEAYAKSWIYNSMIQFLRKDKLVNPSEKVIRSFRLYDRTFTDLQAELGREPDESEVAEAMNISEADLEKLLGTNTSTTSLDTSIGDDEDSTLHEILGADEAAPYEEMEAFSLAKGLTTHMGKLSNSELSIVLLRWFPMKQSDLSGEHMSIETALERMKDISFRHITPHSPEGRAFFASKHTPTP